MPDATTMGEGEGDAVRPAEVLRVERRLVGVSTKPSGSSGFLHAVNPVQLGAMRRVLSNSSPQDEAGRISKAKIAKLVLGRPPRLPEEASHNSVASRRA